MHYKKVYYFLVHIHKPNLFYPLKHSYFNSLPPQTLNHQKGRCQLRDSHSWLTGRLVTWITCVLRSYQLCYLKLSTLTSPTSQMILKAKYEHLSNSRCPSLSIPESSFYLWSGWVSVEWLEGVSGACRIWNIFQPLEYMLLIADSNVWNCTSKQAWNCRKFCLCFCVIVNYEAKFALYTGRVLIVFGCYICYEQNLQYQNGRWMTSHDTAQIASRLHEAWVVRHWIKLESSQWTRHHPHLQTHAQSSRTIGGWSLEGGNVKPRIREVIGRPSCIAWWIDRAVVGSSGWKSRMGWRRQAASVRLFELPWWAGTGGDR